MNGGQSRFESHSVDQARIDRNWQLINFELDMPKTSRIERILRVVGLPSHLVRVAVATPSLRRAWFVATAMAVVVGLAATDATSQRDDLFVWLMLAPIVPVLGVALSFGPDSDPAYEIALSTPMRGIRLILIRTVTILATSIPVLSVTSLAAPESQMAFAWLLPAFGLSAVALAAMTFMTPRRAASGTAGLWILAVNIARNASTDPLAGFSAAGQVGVLILGLAATVLVVARRDRFDLMQGAP